MQYLDSVRPPIQGYIIYHNTTINGDTTSIFVPDNRSLISYEIEIPSEFPSDRFEVSITIINVLGEGEKVTSIVEAELITPAGKEICKCCYLTCTNKFNSSGTLIRIMNDSLRYT